MALKVYRTKLNKGEIGEEFYCELAKFVTANAVRRKLTIDRVGRRRGFLGIRTSV